MKQERSEILTGRIGEFIAAAVIEQMGWQTAFCQQQGVDLICWDQSTYLRVQVKASTYHRERYGKLQWHFGMGGKKRKPTPDDYDLAALVSVPQRRVWFKPITDVTVLTISRQHTMFDDESLESQTFQQSIEALHEFYRNGG